MSKKYFISFLNDEGKKKYINRSTLAINSLKSLDNNAILGMGKHIVGKIIEFAKYMGCKRERNSCYNYFIPINNNEIYFQFRLSDHFNEKKENYLKWEAIGVPNKRILIYFDKNCKQPIIKDYTDIYQGTNVIVTRVALPIYFLDSDENISIFKQALIRCLQTGFFELSNSNGEEVEQSTKIQQDTSSNPISECLSHQYDLMYKLGCISEEQLRNMKNTVI